MLSLNKQPRYINHLFSGQHELYTNHCLKIRRRPILYVGNVT